MKQLIDYEDIREGDLIRREDGCGYAVEYLVGDSTPSAPTKATYYLLERAPKLRYAKGTKLWVTDRGIAYAKLEPGTPLILTDDWPCEAVCGKAAPAKSNSTLTDRYFPLASEVTDVEPRKLRWAKGTSLWLTKDFYPWDKGDEIVLSRDWYDDVTYGISDTPYPLLMVSLNAVTDVKPKPLVDVPTVPTLGILTWNTRCRKGCAPKGATCNQSSHTKRSLMAVWHTGPDRQAFARNDSRTQVLSAGFEVCLDCVESFEPYVAVPKCALDDLRSAYGSAGPSNLASSASEFIASRYLPPQA